MLTEIQAGIATANAVVERWERSHERVVPLSEADVRAVLSDADDLVQLLHTADRIGRAGVYQSFGISLKYEREAATGRELVRVRSQLCGGGGSRASGDHRVANPTKALVTAPCAMPCTGHCPAHPGPPSC